MIQRNIVATSFSGSLPEGSLLIWMFAVNKENQMQILECVGSGLKAFSRTGGRRLRTSPWGQALLHCVQS